jgi:hypothetical protein
MTILDYIIEFYKLLSDFTVDMTMTGYIDDDEIQNMKYYNYQDDTID